MKLPYKIILASLLLLTAPAKADDIFDSVTLEGGPIATKHFQGDDEDYRDTHGLGVLKVHTKEYGNWGLYVLSPNSVDKHSIGAGYVTENYAYPVGPFSLEFSGAIGLVTGYQDYPVPLLAGEARLILFQENNWDAGLSMAALPYYIRESNDHNDGNSFGVVVTSPFLSVRYKFN